MDATESRPSKGALAYLFPGEGRGPVAKVALIARSTSHLRLHDWTPASAGEQQPDVTPQKEVLPTQSHEDAKQKKKPVRRVYETTV